MFRPEIIPELPWYAHVLWFAALALLTLQWGLALRWYRQFPRIIPTHWGIDLQPDAWGHKRFLFLLPVIYSLMFIGFAFLLQKPWTFNYPEPLTATNWQGHYITGLIVLRAVLAAVGILFLGILHLTKRAVDRAQKSPAE